MDHISKLIVKLFIFCVGEAQILDNRSIRYGLNLYVPPISLEDWSENS